jgi:hypothetical protein
MKAEVFLDSNIFLYAASGIESGAAKKAIALRLIVIICGMAGLANFG